MTDKTTPILLIEDEENLGLTLKDYLNIKGYSVSWVSTAKEARQSFLQGNYAVILMDIGLPDGNGLALAKEFRELRKDFVLLFLSALNDPNTRLEGLEIGAEDYITKPFELKELTIRLNRIIKSIEKTNEETEQIEHGDLVIWFNRYEVQDGVGNIVNLSQKECAILKLLYFNKNKVISRDEIINEVWGEDAFPSNRTVDNYIVKLRKWCETDSEQTINIESIRGIGYKLKR